MTFIATKAEFDKLDPSDQWLIVANPPVVIEVGQPEAIALPPAPEGEAIVITKPVPEITAPSTPTS